MDISSLTGGAPKQEKPAIEYVAQVVSPIVNGEAKLAVNDKSFTIVALFDAAEIPFAEINELSLVDYVVTVNADSGEYRFAKMGSWCQPFYDALCDAYNKAVLRSLFVTGNPMITAKGGYSFAEPGAAANGSAPVQLYEDSVVVLPPDLSARRVPLCFVSGMDKGDYELTLKLDTGENYTFAKLGYDTAPFAEGIEKTLRNLREQALAAVKGLDYNLTTAQASQIAKLMPKGAAAPLGALTEIAPSFAAALEEKIDATRAAESYKAFKELCDPAQIYIGFRKNEAATGDEGSMDLLGNICENLLGEETADDAQIVNADSEILWMIAPSPEGQYAAVEFAEADTATFVYRTGGDFAAFARQLNRALEAINFKREVIRLTDEELKKPENADYYMAAKRTAALQFVRKNFVGRVIHSSAEIWKRKLIEYF